MLRRVCRSIEFRRRLEASRDRMFRVAFSWCHDRSLAEDLVHDTIAKALGRSSQLREMAQFEGWLFRILTNGWRDYLRTKKEHGEYLEESHASLDLAPETLHSRYDEIERVRWAVGQLSVNQREVLTLVDLEGFSYHVVAEILEVPIGTVMSRLSRAREAMKVTLERELSNQPKGRANLKRVK